MKLRISSLMSGFLGLIITVSFAAFIIIMAINLRTDAINELDSKFISILNLNETILRNTLKRKESLTAALSEDFMIIKAFVDLKSGFESSDGPTLEKIFKPKDKDRTKIIMGDGVEMYEFMHEAHHTQISKYMKNSFFKDIILIGTNGLIFYSYRKEDEFGGHLNKIAGKFDKTDKLQKIVKDLKKSKEVGTADFNDSTGYNIITASPVFIKKKLAGYVATVMSYAHIGKQFSDAGVMGETGAVLLTGKSNQPLTWTARKKANLKNWRLSNELRKKSKKSARKISLNGTDLYSALKTVNISGTQYNIVLQQKDAEIFKHTLHLQITLTIIGIIILVIALLVVMLALKQVSAPLAKVTTELEKVSSGHADEVEGIDTRLLEIQKISDALKVFRENVIEKEKLKVSAQLDRQTAEEKQNELGSLLGQFRHLMASSLKSITEKSSEMKGSADNLLEVATTSTDEAKKASSASSSASSNITAVADATRALTSSIQEVASLTKKASQVVTAANDAAESTNDCVAELSGASDEIGEVIEVISGIAHKTNLLALNATIEAVHAGEAGKSFAIVAEEVRQLADETSQAIGNVDKQIKSVRNSANYAVGLIKIISHSIFEIKEVADSISTAVVEQTGATGQISDKMVSTVDESTIVSDNVNHVAASIGKTSEVANQVIEVSDEFTKLAGRLSNMAEAFLDDVERDLEERKAYLEQSMN